MEDDSVRMVVQSSFPGDVQVIGHSFIDGTQLSRSGVTVHSKPLPSPIWDIVGTLHPNLKSLGLANFRVGHLQTPYHYDDFHELSRLKAEVSISFPNNFRSGFILSLRTSSCFRAWRPSTRLDMSD